MLDSFQNIIFLVCGTIVLFLLYFLYFLLKNNKQISSLKDEINNNKIFITGFKLKEDEHLKQIQSLEMALEQNLVQYREEAKQQQKVLHLQEEMYEEKIKTLAEENKNNLLTKVKEAREDTLKKSRSVLRGQATEHLAPFLIKGVNPKDYRFLGSPVDYICFDGLSDILDGESNEIKEVKFIDIKTGKSSLNKAQRRIRDAILASKVSFSIINPDSDVGIQDDKEETKLE